jgi:hypothetical protein
MMALKKYGISRLNPLSVLLKAWHKHNQMAQCWEQRGQ